MAKKIQKLTVDLEDVIANLPCHVYWLDCNNIFLGCNDLQAKTIGLSSRHEIVGHTISEFQTKENTERILHINHLVITTGKPQIAEEPYLRSDGKTIIFLSHKYPLRNKKGKTIGTIGISFDITDIKQKEDAMVLHEKIQKEKFITMQTLGKAIAHELRTPLNSMISILYNISEHLPNLVSAYELAKENNLPINTIRPWHMNLLKKSAINLSREIYFSNTIIDMLLMNIKNINTNLHTIDTCSATVCIKDALERYPFAETEKKLVSFKKSPDFVFRGNSLLFTHVLFNLLKNALYYVTKAGKGKITIWLESGKKENRLYFKDTGCGISENILPQIFDHFFSKTHGGTGVGLNFCKMVMEGLGGSITCKSQKNKFTEFVLLFPKSLKL